MITIRLAKIRSKHVKFYRIVAIDKKLKVQGKALDIIGTWNPLKALKVINKEKLKLWLKKGALMSKTVSGLIKNS